MANAFINFLKQAAPWTANALAATVPGPIGIVAGIAAKALNKPALATNPGGDNLLASLQPLMQTEEGRMQLAQIEADVQKAFNQLQITELNQLTQLTQIESADRANARQMATQRDIWSPRVLTAFVCLMVGGIIAATIFGLTGRLNATEAAALAGYGGYVFRDFAQAMQFWLGMSSDNAEKTKLISDLTAANIANGK